MASTASLRTPGGAPAPAVAALLVAVILLLPPAPIGAQHLQTGHLQSPLVPSGHLRLGFDPGFTSWDTRFGLRNEDGRVVEEEEALGDDLADPVGFSLFPGLATLQSELDELTGGGNTPVGLGETGGSITKNVTRLDFRAHVGVFDWLTVGGTLPWVKTRTAVDLLFRPDRNGNLGLNPAVTGDPALEGYLGSLAQAADQADARARSVCDADGPGTSCQAAQELAARALDFSVRAQRMYGQSPFFLLGGSPPAENLSQANADLAAELAAAGLPQPASPVFATDSVGADLLGTLAQQSAFGTLPLREQGLWQAGDLELEATVRLLDGEVRDSGALSPRLAWTLAGGALVRLGTGSVDDPAVSLDVGTGDGQMDVEGFGYAGLRVGAHLELRATGRYGVQRSTTLPRRVVAPETLFPPASARRTVLWTPGSYLDLTVSPRWRVSETLALAADYRRYHKGSDEYEITGGGEDGPELDATLLERETERTAEQVAVGIRYSTLGLWRRGETGAPVELSARLVRTVAGSGGQTPKSTRGELSLHLFHRLWGS